MDGLSWTVFNFEPGQLSLLCSWSVSFRDVHHWYWSRFWQESGIFFDQTEIFRNSSFVQTQSRLESGKRPKSGHTKSSGLSTKEDSGLSLD